MPSRSSGAASVSAALTLGSVAGVLPRMRREFDGTGRLSPLTVAWMYSTYVAHAGTTAVALAHTSPAPRSLPRRASSVLGYSLASIGAGLFTAGMSRFGGAAQISGMNDDQLASTGVYRWTRNPQYLGYTTFLVGLAAARRSALAAALAAGAAGAFAWWVPVEERHLRQAYGEPYRRYLTDVPRWLPLPDAA